MLVYKTIENSQKTFYCIVLYTNMAAVTSDANHQLGANFNGELKHAKFLRHGRQPEVGCFSLNSS